MKIPGSQLYLMLPLAFFLAIWAALLWLNTHRIEHQLDQRLAFQMQDLRRAEIELDRDLLRVTTFQLHNYDPLNQDIRKIASLLEQQATWTGLARNKHRYQSLRKRWETALREKLHLAEQAVAKAAIIGNELHYLTTAVDRLRLKAARAGDPLADRLVTLVQGLKEYFIFTNDSQLLDVLAQLASLNADTALSPSARNIVNHTTITLTLIQDLSDLMERYQRPSTQSLFEHLSQLIAQDEATRFQRLNENRKKLALLVVLLLLLLGWNSWRLLRAHQQTRQAQQRLLDGINSLSEGFALFDSQGQLVMHNHRFIEYHPWLAAHQAPDLSYQKIQHLNRQAGVERPTPDDTTLSANKPAAENWYQQRLQTADGATRWFMVRENLSDTGERVLLCVDISEDKARTLELIKLNRAIEQSPVAVMITDHKGEIEYVNPSFEQITGYSLKEVMGRNPRFLKSGRTPAGIFREMWGTITHGKIWQGQLNNRRRNGEYYWDESLIAPVRDSDGHISHFIAFKQDVSQRRAAESAIRLHARIFDTLAEGIIIADARQRILTVNPTFTQITGYSGAEACGRTLRLITSADNPKHLYAALSRSLEAQGEWEGELEGQRKNGEIFPFWARIVTLHEQQQSVSHYIVIFNDISDKKKAQARITHQAHYDALTELPNRTLFFDRINHAMKLAHRDGRGIALLFIDLDRFKEVNDTLGHLVGDELLKQVAARLLDNLREEDTLARLGGDEFVVALEHVGEGGSDAAIVAQKILHALEQPFVLGQHRIHIGASIGITRYPEDATTTVSLLRNADMAMYQAKESGRNTYRFYTSDMNQRIQQTVEMAKALRSALEDEAFYLAYQPIVRISDRQLVGFEALLRWEHPREGLISPEVFIPIAEENGLIGQIGEWVLNSACHQATLWRQQGHRWHVGINLSARQLSLGLSIERLQQIMEQHHLTPSWIVLEITERLMLDGSENTLSWLQAARELGIGLSVDDFGTGYSSLAYLKRYPMDTLKVDRSFIRDVIMDQNDASLVQAIIAMAKALDLKVVAEGVENEEQLAFLQDSGCDYAQGWWFGKPMRAEEIPGFLTGHSHQPHSD